MKQKTITLHNYEIYALAAQIQEQFNNCEDLFYTAIINFCIQYNFNVLMGLAQMIEKSRCMVGKKYGTPSINNDTVIYTLLPENLAIAEQEMDELLNITQELTIYVIPLSILKDQHISMKQMQALLFMIDNDLIEEKKEVP